MKARIWKEDGAWHYDVQGHRLRASGTMATWARALEEALDEMRWIAAHPVPDGGPDGR